MLSLLIKNVATFERTQSAFFGSHNVLKQLSSPTLKTKKNTESKNINSSFSEVKR